MSKKGEPSNAQLAGALEKNNFSNISKERMKEISMMGVKQRKKNAEERLHIRKVLVQLLEMQTNSEQQKEVLKKMGFGKDNLDNKTVMLVALYQRALRGDTSAIRDIIALTDEFENKEVTLQQAIQINLVPVDAKRRDDIDEEEKNMFNEDTEPWEDEDDWGNDVYEK